MCQDASSDLETVTGQRDGWFQSVSRRAAVFQKYLPIARLEIQQPSSRQPGEERRDGSAQPRHNLSLRKLSFELLIMILILMWGPV